MPGYVELKVLHVTAASLTVFFFALRLSLDALGHPGWRRTILSWLPHLNDTLLLASAIGLLLVTGWHPLIHHWLAAKIALLVGYVIAGRYAIKDRYRRSTRGLAAGLALLQLTLIFWLAVDKPDLSLS